MSKKPIGVLLIHGWTASPKHVERIAPPLEAMGLSCVLPTLSGHGADSPEALRHITWHDWLKDAKTALFQQAEQSEKVIVVGHSLGGMLALNLAADHPEIIDSIVVAAATPLVSSPFGPSRPYNFLVPLITLLYKNWNLSPDYAEKSLEQFHTAYPWTPTTSIATLFDCFKETRRRLPQVTVPILIMQSRKDTTNSPEGVQILLDNIKTPQDQKRVVWFEKTNHEMFLDCEWQATVACVADFVKERIRD